jgi:hypothetical protein
MASFRAWFLTLLLSASCVFGLQMSAFPSAISQSSSERGSTSWTNLVEIRGEPDEIAARASMSQRQKKGCFIMLEFAGISNVGVTNDISALFLFNLTGDVIIEGVQVTWRRTSDGSSCMI